MNIQLTQKERLLLEDQKSHEEICIKKYTDYSNQTQDPQLKQILQGIALQEQEHLNTVNQLLSGQVPSMPSGSSSSSGSSGAGSSGGQAGSSGMQGGTSGMQGGGSSMARSQGGMSSQQGQGSASGSYNAQDKDMCTDLLMTEKYVSSTYDTAIFECVDTNVREVLNHIQKEEQQHGEQIFNYMQSKGMYIPK